MAGTFQPKLGSPREVVVGLPELEQALMIVIRTQVGSVPGRPTFGVALDKILDRPVNNVRGAAVREIKRGMRASEPRITVLDVQPIASSTSATSSGRLTFGVSWKPTNPIDPTRPNVTRVTEVSL